MQLLRIGAEARIFKIGWHGIKAVKKIRERKRYRNKLLDDQLCEERMRKEVILMHKAKEMGVATPTILNISPKRREIVFEYISGKKAKETIEQNSKLCKSIGKCIATLHNAGIIHGDLTMDNIIVRDGLPVFIDFGLGFYSNKLEDKATDLLNLKKAFLP